MLLNAYSVNALMPGSKLPDPSDADWGSSYLCATEHRTKVCCMNNHNVSGWNHPKCEDGLTLHTTFLS